MIKKKVRLKITDFWKSPIEETVMSFLQMIKNEIKTFTVVLWYEKGDIDKQSILNFCDRYKEQINILEIDIIELSGIESYVWYDIISEDDATWLSRYKFRSIYSNNNNIINCIMEFNSIIKFDKQKNMSYRNAKDRNNRFKKVGRQDKD